MEELQAKIEALLFAHGEPIRISELARLLEVSEEALRNAVAGLREAYRERQAGLVVIRRQDEVALGTRPEFGELLKKILGEEFRQELTEAAVETLAIVAYRGPISRPEIDAIRGVNSAFMVRNLMLRGLLFRERDPQRPQMWLYDITLDCMKMLGLTHREELPDFEKLSKALDSLETLAQE
jgi:segregation and condensation protein B